MRRLHVLAITLPLVTSCAAEEAVEQDVDEEDEFVDPDAADEPFDDGLDAPGDPTPLVIKNPVRENCADPSVMRHGDRWYMSCTGGTGGNLFPVYESSNLLEWTRVSWVFPAGAPRPTWANANWWAPALHHIDGGFAAYFSARSTSGTMKNAVGVATSSSITGPFTDRGTPVVQRTSSAIDANVVKAADGVRYLYGSARDARALYERAARLDPRLDLAARMHRVAE